MRDDGRRRKGTAADGGGLRHVFRAIIGAPDYEAYLEHCRTAGHAPRMTEREFVAAFFESKGTGVRCC